MIVKIMDSLFKKTYKITGRVLFEICFLLILSVICIVLCLDMQNKYNIVSKTFLDDEIKIEGFKTSLNKITKEKDSYKNILYKHVSGMHDMIILSSEFINSVPYIVNLKDCKNKIYSIIQSINDINMGIAKDASDILTGVSK